MTLTWVSTNYGTWHHGSRNRSVTSSRLWLLSNKGSSFWSSRSSHTKWVNNSLCFQSCSHDLKSWDTTDIHVTVGYMVFVFVSFCPGIVNFCRFLILLWWILDRSSELLEFHLKIDNNIVWPHFRKCKLFQEMAKIRFIWSCEWFTCGCEQILSYMVWSVVTSN